MNQTLINCTHTVDEYISGRDWRIKANANTGYSNAGLVNNIAGKVIANYWLDEVYSPEEGQAHRDGFYHIHDLDCLTGYCAGWSLRNLLNEGFNGVDGRVSSRPPRHFREALGQMSNFLGILQSEWAGAQAFSSFDTYLAPYVFYDKLTFEEIKKAIRQFVYNLNVPARWGQSPFTNITLDITVPQDLQYQQPTKDNAHLFEGIVDKELLLKLQERDNSIKSLTDSRYKHFVYEMEQIVIAYYEVMTEGDSTGQPFTFPIPTVNITEDFDWNSRVADAIFENTAKVGSSYFQNFVGSQWKLDENGNRVQNPDAYSPGAVRSMCPLTGDTEVLVKTSKGISIQPIENVVKNSIKRGTDTSVWNGTAFVKASPVLVPATEVLEICLTNGTSVKMGINHLQPTKDDGVLAAKDLKVGMFLPFNRSPIEINQYLGSHELGFAVGAYLGDGSRDNDGICYSICGGEKSDDVANTLTSFWENLGYRVTTTHIDNVRSIRVGGNSFDVISRFISGTTATTKNIADTVYNMTVKFREGLLRGLIMTDGSRDKNRISTSSKSMARSLVSLFHSIGHKGLISYTDSREGRLGKNDNYIISYPDRERYGEKFDQDDAFHYYSISSINTVENTSGLYCFEVDDSSHLFMLANGLITHNCRLQLDLRELLKRGNGLFGSAEMTGSIGVVTLNMARLGKICSGNRPRLEQQLKSLIALAVSTLEKKRKFLTEMYESGLFPYTKRYLPSFRNHFSTIGVNGMNEMLLNFSEGHMDITLKEGQEFAGQILDLIREVLKEVQATTGHMYNLEATPAEGTTYRLAKSDVNQYPDIFHAGPKDAPYYTNSSQLPVGFTDDPFEALDRQNALQCKYTGGTVLHLYMSEKIPNIEACKRFVKTVLDNYQLPYITVTPVFSTCIDHGYISGEKYECPTCGKKTNIWTRVMGYFRPVNSFNIGKLSEFTDRMNFKLTEKGE